MQMGEASEHRPGDYGRWESSLWSPWHQGSHFGRSLSPPGAGDEGRRMDGWIEWWKGEKEGGGKRREEHVMVSFPHMRRCLTPTSHPPKKGRNKSISGVSGICVIY